MFIVDATFESIPSLDEVPETQEEKKRRRTIQLIVAAVILLLLAVAAVTTIFLVRRARVASAIETAENDGRSASVEHALSLLDGDDTETRAVRARLLAGLVLEGAAEEEEAARLVTEDRAESEGNADRLIAATYLALARGDVTTATQNASQLQPVGDLAAEAARARSLASLAVANLELAAGQATAARDARPEAPRYAALLGQVLALQGNMPASVDAVQTYAEAGDPNARLVRGWARFRGATEMEAALQDVRSLANDDTATPAEKGWGRLVEGRILAHQGSFASARSALEAAREAPPPGDQRFQLLLAEGFLRIGDVTIASAILDAVGPASADPPMQAALEVALMIHRDDREAATAALSRLPASPRASLLRGRLAAKRGDLDAARSELTRAAEDVGLAIEAKTTQAAMEIASGNGGRARDLLEPLHEELPNHPEVASLLADAERALQNYPAAFAALNPGLSQSADDALLLTAKARVEMAKEDWTAAYTSLRSAVENDPRDADRQADLGRVAREVGEDAVAREAFDAALALDAKHDAALVGRLELDLDEEHVEDAVAILERIDGASIRSLAVERLRARVLVLDVRGMSGVRPLRQGVVREGVDRWLLLGMGKLYLQAEQYDAAAGAFSRAKDLFENAEESNAEAALLHALAYARGRRTPPAETILSNLPSGLDEELRALRAVVEGRIAQVAQQRIRFRERAQTALELSPKLAEAHLLLADFAESRDANTVPHLRRALDSVPSSAEAMGRLSLIEETPRAERCALARRYLRAAPRGGYAQDVRELARSCRD